MNGCVQSQYSGLEGLKPSYVARSLSKSLFRGEMLQCNDKSMRQEKEMVAWCADGLIRF